VISGVVRMIVKIDHLGIAVKNLDEALKIYSDALGLKPEAFETREEAKIKMAFIPVGESDIELMEPIDGVVAKFIAERGEGIHHVCFRVSNIEEALKKLKDKGVRLVDEKPRVGARQSKMAFIHPKATAGTLIELVERPG
jgi:methylmalonyl-CoA/ethylmalonyl-CoA epimerase